MKTMMKALAGGVATVMVAGLAHAHAAAPPAAASGFLAGADAGPLIAALLALVLLAQGGRRRLRM